MRKSSRIINSLAGVFILLIVMGGFQPVWRAEAAPAQGSSPNPLQVINTIALPIQSSSDDAMQGNIGPALLTDPSLTLGDVAVSPSYVGLRFTNVPIDQATPINQAYLSLTSQGNWTNGLTIFINGHDVGNSPPFTSSNGPFNRQSQITASEVSWTPGPWSDVAAYQSPDLTSIVQEIVNRSDWAAGNALSLLIRDDGVLNNVNREVVAWDSNPSMAAELTIVYTLGGLVVNTTDDLDDGTCDGIHCSLREAINVANANSGADTITFNIPGSAPYVIDASPMPTLTDSGTIIDGTTQPGYTGSPIVEVTWSGMGAVADPSSTDPTYTAVPPLAPGFWVQAADTTIRGLSITGWTSNGILIEGPTASNIVVEGNYIGVQTDGVTANGNTWASGIGVFRGATSVQIANNVISGNDRGILIAQTCPFICLGTGGEPSGVLIENNKIGTDAGGTIAVGNDVVGISVTHSPDTTILNNVISGNTQTAISIGYDSPSDSPIPSTAQIQGNKIGTDITGTGALGNGTGIWVGGGDNSQILNNLISDNGTGIYVSSHGVVPVTGLLIQDNLIGTTAGGMAALGVQELGVLLFQMSSGTQLMNNVISGHTIAGVRIGADSTDNVIQGNLIGLDSSGSFAIGNQAGIEITGSLTSNNLIGGSGAGEGNVISGNSQGIQISAPGVIVQGNLVGTDASGTSAVGNIDGIILGASGVVIGGGGPGEGNVISGNSGIGIFMTIGSSGNLVLGNTIGLDVSGNLLGNQYGVHVRGDGNIIGGPNPGEGNIVSGNTFTGIFVPDGINHQINSNVIGEDGAGNPAGNGGSGISITATDTVVLNNLVAHNLAAGIEVVNQSGANTDNIILQNEIYENSLGVRIVNATGNTISGNTMQDNVFLGIDLRVFPGDPITGVTLNDPGDGDSGANELLNFPEFTNVTTTLAEGTACSGCTVEIFLSDDDPSGYGEGQTFLADGIASGGAFSIPLPAGQVQFCDKITATATDANGNTSEFSANTAPGGLACISFNPAILILGTLIPGLVVGGWVYRGRKSLPKAVGGFVGGAIIGGAIVVLGGATWERLRNAPPAMPAERVTQPVTEELSSVGRVTITATYATTTTKDVATPTITNTGTTGAAPSLTFTPTFTLTFTPLPPTATFTPLPLTATSTPVPPTFTPTPTEDTLGPKVTNISATPSEIFTSGNKPDTTTISATVVDPAGVSSVMLYYKLEGGKYVLAGEMKPAGGGVYQLKVGPFAKAGTYTIRIVAVDGFGNANCSTSNLDACSGGTFIVKIP